MDFILQIFNLVLVLSNRGWSLSILWTSQSRALSFLRAWMDVLPKGWASLKFTVAQLLCGGAEDRSPPGIFAYFWGSWVPSWNWRFSFRSFIRAHRRRCVPLPLVPALPAALDLWTFLISVIDPRLSTASFFRFRTGCRLEGSLSHFFQARGVNHSFKSINGWLLITQSFFKMPQSCEQMVVFSL